MAVLVLGGYGLIGSAIVERLAADGLEVIGLGRDTAMAERRWPIVAWRQADLSRLTTPQAWRPILKGVEVVVNAAGALQQGLSDDLTAVQDRSMKALYDAAKPAAVRRIVQISAVGATLDSPLRFFSTKARADAALCASGLEHVILRPALVISPGAYGGTALLRGLAAFPVVLPLVLSRSPVRTVWIGDVADAVAAAVAGRIDAGASVELAEAPTRSLAETVQLLRGWLGLPPAPVVALPDFVAGLTAIGADVLGWLGWRSPLRSTAMAVMKQGVLGGGGAEHYLGHTLKTLPEMLAAMPAGAQERWFARLWLLKPLILGGLAAFWLASGMIGLAHHAEAAAVLTRRSVPEDLARLAVLTGALADVGLGAALLFRPLARWALRGMAVLSLLYVAGGSMLAPDLWLDPLGPLVKVLPALVLTFVALAILDER
ncbi:SDR family oxidoreductase [Phenylobacterium sp.]|uniref:SDR family oxidoreductase n=1 Tax=Phenylobacterium sp. TaxID=1871053 RepID=UPI003568F193